MMEMGWNVVERTRVIKMEFRCIPEFLGEEHVHTGCDAVELFSECCAAVDCLLNAAVIDCFNAASYE